MLGSLGFALSMLENNVQSYGLRGIPRWAGLAYHRAGPPIEGVSIFAEQWDVCVVLDACRLDELERAGSKFDWIEDVESRPSLASCTWNWLPRTIEETDQSTLQNTTYVSSNPFSSEFCADEDFFEVDEVWRYAWDETIGTVLPRPVTDRAIAHARDGASDRLLVHYLQPHVPFLCEGSGRIRKGNFELGTESHVDDWDRVTKGDLERKTAISWYRKTLETVLDEVDLLLANIDARKVVITADHGEAFGEWGVYGHPSGFDHPSVTNVPWVETTATDDGEHEPADYDTAGQGIDRDEQLRALGYR